MGAGAPFFFTRGTKSNQQTKKIMIAYPVDVWTISTAATLACALGVTLVCTMR